MVIFIISMFYRNSCVYANSLYPDQTPRSVASDLGPDCLPMSHLYETPGINWLNGFKNIGHGSVQN